MIDYEPPQQREVKIGERISVGGCMTKAHPHRQVNVHLDTVDDADVIERIVAQPSMVGYIRELVRRDIHDERLDYAALKASELQTENAKLREEHRAYQRAIDDLVEESGVYMDENIELRELLRELYEDQCDECDRWKYRDRMRKLGVE